MFVVLVYTKWSFEILVVQTSQTLCQKWKFIEKSPRNMALLAVPSQWAKKWKNSAINNVWTSGFAKSTSFENFSSPIAGSSRLAYSKKFQKTLNLAFWDKKAVQFSSIALSWDFCQPCSLIHLWSWLLKFEA